MRQSMLNRFHLGNLISYERTPKGVGNQTMFIKSSSGEYVLKGNPLYRGQLIEEQFYVNRLHKRTRLPVPMPYLIDGSDDIFGWSYAIMPLLPGRHITDPDLAAQLGEEDKKQIAELLAKSLCELHNWKVDHYGELDLNVKGIRSFEISYKIWLYNRIKYWLKDAQQYSVISPADIEWVENVLAASEHVFDCLHTPIFVMGDFKADNILVQRNSDGWQLSGIIDFTTGYFGDGLSDLPKMVILYLDQGETELARRFIDTYFHCCDAREGFLERFRVHMLHQRVLDWGCAYATNRVTWDVSHSFSQWAEKYIESAAI